MESERNNIISQAMFEEAVKSVDVLLGSDSDDLEDVENISDRIKSVVLKKSQLERKMIGQILCFRKISFLTRYVSYLNIENETDRIDLAIMSANIDGRKTSNRISNFNIQDNDSKIVIAKTCAFHDGEGASYFLGNYNFTDIKTKIEIMKIALLNNPDTIANFPKVFPDLNLTSVDKDAPIEDVENWIRINLSKLAAISSTSITDIYADTKRRNTGIRLIAGYLGNQIDDLDSQTSSKKALLSVTGLPNKVFSLTGLSSTALSNLYEVALDLQSKSIKPIFNIIRIEEALLERKPQFRQTITMLSDLGTLLNLIGTKDTNGAYKVANLLSKGLSTDLDTHEILGVLNQHLSEAGEENSVVITLKNLNLISYLVNQSIIAVFDKYISESGNKNISFTDIKSISNRWGDVSNLFVLFSRYNNKTEWKDEIRVLARIIFEFKKETFLDYKYEGDKTDTEDYELLTNQTHILSKEQLRIWRQNLSKLNVFKSNVEISQVDAFENAKIQIAEKIEGLPIQNQKWNGDIEIENLSDKDFQKKLKDIFLSDTQAMLLHCLNHLKSLNSNETLRKGISRIKSAKDLLKLDKSEMNFLTSINDSISHKGQDNLILIFTSAIDSANLMLNIGELTGTFSCHNINTGSKVHTLPGYTIDPNTKAIISYIIKPNNELSVKDLKIIAQDLQDNPTNVNINFNQETQNITISTRKGQSYNYSLRDIFYRRVIKLGESINDINQPVLVQEPEFIQTHSAIQIMKDDARELFFKYAKLMGAKVEVPAKISKSRNKLGTYSDIAKGVQKETYLV